eukprot:1909819-Prymnesium_polylepis.1
MSAGVAAGTGSAPPATRGRPCGAEARGGKGDARRAPCGVRWRDEGQGSGSGSGSGPGSGQGWGWGWGCGQGCVCGQGWRQGGRQGWRQ